MPKSYFCPTHICTKNFRSLGSTIVEIWAHQNPSVKNEDFGVVLGKPLQNPNGSMVFKTACAKILSTAPSTTYINLGQIRRPRLSRLGRGLYRMAHIRFSIGHVVRKLFDHPLLRISKISFISILYLVSARKKTRKSQKEKRTERIKTHNQKKSNHYINNIFFLVSQKDGGRYDRKSAQLEILICFIWNFQESKVSVLVVTPEIFSLIGSTLPYFHIEPKYPFMR